MPIYTLADLRAQSNQKYKSLSDEEFLRKYSEVKNLPFDEVADYFGVTPRGTLSQIGTGLVKGADVGLREMAGKALQWGAEKLAPGMEDISAAATAGLPERRAPMQQPGEFQAGVVSMGKGLETSAAEREKAYLPPDLRRKNWLQQGMIEGSESIAPSVATLGAAMVNPAIGAGLALSLIHI